MQRIQSISSDWSHTTWAGATIPLNHLATPVWVALRRLQVLDLLRKLRNASPWQTASMICELQPFRDSCEIDDELKTKITDTIYVVMNAHIDSSDHEPGTFGRYKGRPLRRLVINADAIHALVRLLSSDEPPVLQFASWALGCIANENSLKTSVIDAGSCQPLVALLQHEVVDVHREALRTLTNLSYDSEVGRQAIVDADALPEFVRLLSSSDPRVLEYASMALGDIAYQNSFITSVVDVGSCRPLVALLRHEDVDVHRQALRPFASLACGSEAAKWAIIDADALPEFVHLLSSSDPRVLEYASGALNNIASQNSFRTSVVDAGPCRPLVALLRHEVVDVHRNALGALANLSSSSQVVQRAIVDADALPEFVRLLSSSDPRVLQYASMALANIAYRNSFGTSVVDVGPCRPLVALLQHEVVDVHREALRALVNLVCDSEVGRRAIVDADALLEFVRLLSSSDSRVLKYTSIVLGNIASENSFRTSVVDAGPCRPLVALLRHEVVDVHRAALCAFTNLSYDSEVGRRGTIEADALLEFVRLLSSSDPQVLEYASTALSNIANENSFRTSVVDAGPCRPLVALLRHEVVDVHRAALCAFTNLSYDSEVGRQAIVDADALPEFVRLLSSSEPRVLEYASMALGNIASQNSFRTSIIDAGSCRPLVVLLRHEVVDVHRHALRALASLSASSEVGQRAIIDADGLLELKRLLLSSDPRVRKYASITLHNVTRTVDC